MYDPINQIQSTNDEDEDQTEEELNVKDSAIKDSVQDSFLSYYSHTNFRQQQDLACLNAVSTPSNPSKISEIQEGFDLASPKTKAKKRKVAAVDGGGRVVRAAGRKDKHSKVCTNRGPRDRRVRLSPTTAIQFYDVQDRLGYDRPSKAIDWLINEAKTAIDALDEQPSINFGDANSAEHHGFSLSQGGMREKEEDLNNESLASDFGSFLDEAPPPPAAALEAYLDQDSIFVRNKSEINLYPNWEMFTNCGNEDFGSVRGGDGGAQYFSGDSPLLHAAAQPISSHVNLFTQREPLQSSVVNYSPINNDYFAGFSFSNDLSKIAASATAKQDQNSKKMSFTIPSATAHYQD